MRPLLWQVLSKIKGHYGAKLEEQVLGENGAHAGWGCHVQLSSLSFHARKGATSLSKRVICGADESGAEVEMSEVSLRYLGLPFIDISEMIESHFRR